MATKKTHRDPDSYRARRRNMLRDRRMLHLRHRARKPFDTVRQSLQRLAYERHIKVHGIDEVRKFYNPETGKPELRKTGVVLFPLSRTLNGAGRMTLGAIHRRIALAIVNAKARKKRGRFAGVFGYPIPA